MNDEFDDDLGPVRGMATACCVGVVFWLVVGLIWWLL
jgi:hypothetical protein